MRQLLTLSQSGIPTAWDPEVEDSTEVGFPNLVVQCYRNATLQLLLHAPVFCNWLNWYKNHHAPKGYTCQRGEDGKECKVCQFQALCAVYWDGGVGKWKTTLNTITESVYDTWRADQEDEQSDAGEYLEEVVSQLREATKPMLYVLFRSTYSSVTTNETRTAGVMWTMRSRWRCLR